MKFMKWIVVIAVFATAGLAYANTEVKFGYVDFNRALNEVNDGKKAKSQLQTEFNDKQKKLEKAQDELKAMKEELDKKRLLLSAEALQKKEETFRKKAMDLQQMMFTFKQEMAAREAKVTGDILNKLREIVNEIGKKEKYTMILEKSQDVVLYSPNSDDLTDRVIKTYNKGSKK